jgi:chromate transporter
LSAPPVVPLGTLFWIFFRIACTSFGGFMAMISVVQNVVVERKKLMRHEEMLDGISLASLLPGPVAVNLVVYVGYRLRGALGALLSGFAAVLPSFLFIVALGIAYFRFGQMPIVEKLFMGFIPAMTAIIVAAAWNIGGFFSTVGIILAGGIVGWIWFRHSEAAAGNGAESGLSAFRPGSARAAALPLLPAAAAPLLALDPGLVLKVFVVFAGMSVMLFGGGYVFVPLIQEIVVDGQGWVTQREFVDAIVLGQVTPGPILVSAAFIGLKVAGLAGAVAATVGIYLPPALLMVASARVLDRIKRSVAVKAALRGVRPAVIGMIFAAAVVIGRTAVPVWISVAIFAAALYALARWRVEAVWIIPPAGVLGLLLY